MRLILGMLLGLSPLVVLAADPPGPTPDAKLIRSIAEGADHPIILTGTVRSRALKQEASETYWLLKIGSIKMLMGAPRQTIEVTVPGVFYFNPGFQRVMSRVPSVYPPYAEQPQVFYPGDRVLMIAQQQTTASDPKGPWRMILTRYLNDDTGRLFYQDGFYLNGPVADSLAYLNQSAPPDSVFCRRIMQPTETTLQEVKSVLAEMAAPPAKKTP